MSEKMEFNNFGKKIMALKVKSYEENGDILSNIVVINNIDHIFMSKSSKNGAVFAKFVSFLSENNAFYIRLGGANESQELLLERYEKLLEGYHDVLLCDGGLLKEIKY